MKSDCSQHPKTSLGVVFSLKEGFLIMMKANETTAPLSAWERPIDFETGASSARIKKTVMTAMLCALAYIVMVLIHIKLMPAAPFLTYDPKDAVIVMGGFLFGPGTALIISLVVSFLEMITVSESGIIGFVMQVIATLSFAGVASAFYRSHLTKRGAVTGLVLGSVCMVIVMVLWNYILSPIYLGTDRAAVVAMLVPAIIPFNVIKCALNACIAFLLYKPLVGALRRSGLVDERRSR